MTDQNSTPVAKPRRTRKPKQAAPAAQAAPEAAALEVAVQPSASSPGAEKKPTKKEQLVLMLRQECGVTLPELVAALGWLPHTARAALTGLRKAGHFIDKGKRDGVTYYRIKANA